MAWKPLSADPEAAIGRTGRTDVVLPLMVAASIGGAERGGVKG